MPSILEGFAENIIWKEDVDKLVEEAFAADEEANAEWRKEEDKDKSEEQLEQEKLQRKE